LLQAKYRIFLTEYLLHTQMRLYVYYSWALLYHQILLDHQKKVEVSMHTRPHSI